MELGEKILRARQALGLSQRQLCGDVITRNMLSQIEHGTAKPSMDTLRYLAGRLNQPVSYFMEEDAVTLPNWDTIRRARQALDAGDPASALDALAGFREPDEFFHREHLLLTFLAHIALAEQALAENRLPYARELLERAGAIPAGLEELERTRALLLLRAGASDAIARLPSLDEELLIRARAALTREDAHRAAALLDAAQNQDTPQWCLLRGEAYLAQQQWAQAAQALHRAEEPYPEETAPLLEACYRELGDYRKAYAYACKQRQ